MKVAYCCTGGGRTGWGHVFRGLAVVGLARHGSALLVGEGFEEVAANLARTHPEVPVEPWESAHSPLHPVSSGYDVLMIDHYGLGSRWIGDASENIPTYVVDDWMRAAPNATGLINPNVGACPGDYPGARVTEWYTGSAYALLRSDVLKLRQVRPLTDAVHTILITMGGSDPDCIAGQVLTVVARLPAAVAARIEVIAGPSHASAFHYPERTPAGTPVEVVVQPPDFLDRCSAADLIICSASTVASEVACLGRPFIPLSYTANQRRIAAAWAAQGVGADTDTRRAGWQTELFGHLMRVISDTHLRRQMAATGASLVDGNGAARILSALGASQQ